jgi:hypothetical protein
MMPLFYPPPLMGCANAAVPICLESTSPDGLSTPVFETLTCTDGPCELPQSPAR